MINLKKQKEPLTVEQLADKLTWRAFGNDKFGNELNFIMMNRGRMNDSWEEVLADILRNLGFK